jgi:hypothetical protein
MNAFVPILMVLIIGGGLFAEQRCAEQVNLAFFRINVLIGTMVLGTVLAGTWQR